MRQLLTDRARQDAIRFGEYWPSTVASSGKWHYAYGGSRQIIFSCLDAPYTFNHSNLPSPLSRKSFDNHDMSPEEPSGSLATPVTPALLSVYANLVLQQLRHGNRTVRPGGTKDSVFDKTVLHCCFVTHTQIKPHLTSLFLFLPRSTPLRSLLGCAVASPTRDC